ncbi:homoserine dehydrogenase [Acetobacter indonesiensis NRIC 0313]|uniref:Homoserine dehydrogenase n=1 Tax=Acetobacter indonesiensis TaxID=104101 RepID=A0A252ASL5_9PROT|nr:homoserine dehydrogenase [Acetobacter indonesiensis]OUI93167.1 homoserine dehydrogenase [Acetobacter indonesiensis]GAN63021.1 homoserine dehydrogenase [Acetobacter indonesiensis]GBQ57428.1 homoserine dehydrogenase [Acetobacter indonesiensis NRIC 0313]GEN04498.1 homoserine dehydrogenase [Acetobacter indonesiensis]
MSVSSSSSPLRLGIAGLGTVGAGVIHLLETNAELITARAGRSLHVVAVSARDRTRDRGVNLSGLRWYDNAVDLVSDPDVDVVVELIGGAEGQARALVEAALAAGKPVVTANKALLAIHGPALAKVSAEKSAPLLFEAAVAGGIPAIKTVREGLAADRLLRIGGILNGTCNYILTVMRETGKDFGTVLADAQKLGYAEADPSTDIDGLDAAHKLTILAGLAFGRPVAFDSVHVEGIRRIGAADLNFARKLGYRIKLLGLARMGDAGLEARVTPCLVPEDAPIAQVDGVFNAVVAEGAFAGRLMIEGRGAGAGPTASAVTADLIDIARGNHIPVWGVQAADITSVQACPLSAGKGAFYLRLRVEDRPGVIADITAVLRDCGVSLRSMLQPTPEKNDTAPHVPLVLVTHQTSEAAMQDAVTRIDGLDVVTDTPVMIRIETD